MKVNVLLLNGSSLHEDSSELNSIVLIENGKPDRILKWSGVNRNSDDSSKQNIWSVLAICLLSNLLSLLLPIAPMQNGKMKIGEENNRNK